jgi:phospholipid/cholesterol/gamma-HCH transport system substrate-binding protein
VHLPTSPGNSVLPSLPVPTGTATTCITLLGLPVCTPKLNRSGFDPDLARALMPGAVS